MKTSAMEPLRFLSWEEMDLIHNTALQILEKTGMKVDHIKALEYLEAAGCKVDMDTRIVKFPASVVEDAVARMHTNFADPDRYPKRMSVRYSQVRFDKQPFYIHEDFSVSAGGFCCFIWDLEGNRRWATMDDVRKSIRLVNRLDQISYTGLPCAAQEVPVGIRPVVMAAELAKNTIKLGGIETFKPSDVEYITRIGEVVAGGREEHRKNPVLVGYAEARTPLCIDEVMADVMLAHLERGLPQSLDTMPNLGATAPATAAGGMALGMAETLGGLVLGYAIDPNATMTMDFTPGYCDMHSMIFGYAGAERFSLMSARVQLISEYYGCPSGVHGGKTNSCVPGVQSGVEKASTMLAAVLAGAIGFGTVGHLENALTFSPLQLVMDNEIARYVRRCVRGIDVNADTLAVDIIEQVGINGSFIGTEHTADHFRDELMISEFFNVSSWGIGNSLDKERFEELARQRIDSILTQEQMPVLSPEQEAEIDEIVLEAKQQVQ